MFRNNSSLEQQNKYYSTNLRISVASFREALLKGLAPDGGLYMPVHFPLFSESELEAFSELTYHELASEIIGRFIGTEISREVLSEICKEVYNFSIPLEHISERSYIMRLDQGPTASFKDFAALAMGRLMQYFLQKEKKHILILTATSGDTGSAVANAFYGLENIRAIILFPSGEVSEIQRKQITTFGNNIQAIEVNGKFDDCQRLVKRAFLDESLKELNLSSANSINIGRLLPQSVYYFWAWARLSGKPFEEFVFSVPSGNFGNLTGGLIAMKAGLPVKCFVISTNENNEVPEFLKTGIYNPVSPSRNCISSAMNVGHPSNLARIVSMYGGIMDENGLIHNAPDLEKMRIDLYGASFSDQETRQAIISFYRHYKILLEPHGAVAWLGLQEYLKNHPPANEMDTFNVCLETAHPSKFTEEIRTLLNIELNHPDSLTHIEARIEEYISLENNYEVLKEFLIRNY